MTRWLLYPSKFEPIPPPTATSAAPIQWFAPLSEPRRLVVAAAVLAASGCTLPPQPPVAVAVAPSFGWFAPLSLPIPVKRQYLTEFKVPAQQPIGAPVFGWYRPLSEPYFQPQNVRTRFALVTSQVWAFKPPAAPPTAPPMAFFRPLSEPFFKNVKYPTTLIQFPSWALPEPVATPIWTPVVPGSGTWTPATENTDLWTPQIPGTTTWTPQ